MIQDTNQEGEFVCICNERAVLLAKEVLVENEGGYLEGIIEMKNDTEAILTKFMQTTDLLMTWQSLIDPILIEGKTYDITILDSICEVMLVKENVGGKINATFRDNLIIDGK